MNQSTMTGCLGEVAFEVLMAMAWEICMAKIDLRIDFISAARYLEVLIGKLAHNISQETAQTLEHMREHLKGAFVRVNQVVQTVSELSVDMLCDYFIRASAIRCKHGQKAIDLSTPMYFPETPEWPATLEEASYKCNEDLAANSSDAISSAIPQQTHTAANEAENHEERLKKQKFGAEGMSQVAFQVKDTQNFLTASEKAAWLDSVDKLDFLDQNASLPSVVFCCQFNSSQSAEEELKPDSGNSRASLPLVGRSQILVKKNGIKHVRYVIFLRRPKPSDMDASFTEDTDIAFNRLLEFNTNIMQSGNIDNDDIKHFYDREHVQPEYTRKSPWKRPRI
jgi:hypothetical protein